MTDFLLLTRDTMGWWGALAWIIKIDDVLGWLWSRFQARRNGTPRPGHTHGHNLVLATIAMGVLSAGLVLLGTTLPLHTRLEMFANDSEVFWAALATGWTLLAVAGWLFVIARAARPAIIATAAALALGGTALAAALTVGGA